MAMNWIEFRPDLSMAEFMRRFGTRLLPPRAGHELRQPDRYRVVSVACFHDSPRLVILPARSCRRWGSGRAQGPSGRSTLGRR